LLLTLLNTLDYFTGVKKLAIVKQKLAIVKHPNLLYLFVNYYPIVM